MKIIGIIGEGKMGTNLFHYISDFPFEMRWIVSPAADVEKISKTWSKKIARGVNTAIIDEAGAVRRNRAIITRDLQAACDCDLIIEALPENENIKLEVFRNMEPIAPPHCIFASNSSSILPSRLSPSESRTPNVIGIHFFYPVSLKNIVELIVHPKSDLLTIERSITFLNTIQRKYLYQAEQDAFLLNRIYLEVQLEAWLIIREKMMSPTQLDRLVRSRLFPLGPFECMDVVGMDVMLPSIRNYTRHYPDPARYESLLEELQRLVAVGRLGMKSGKGFFDHTESGSDQDRQVPSPPEEIADAAVARLRTTLNTAIENLSAGVSCPKVDILEGLKEYFGE